MAAGWFAACQLTGATEPVSGAKAGAWQATKCWAVGIPVSHTINDCHAVLAQAFPELCTCLYSWLWLASMVLRLLSLHQSLVTFNEQPAFFGGLTIKLLISQAGIVLRSALKGHTPEIGFVTVTMAFTLITLVGWRTIYAALTSGKVCRLL